jgi:outer membrane protein assembly factor BamD
MNSGKNRIFAPSIMGKRLFLFIGIIGLIAYSFGCKGIKDSHDFHKLEKGTDLNAKYDKAVAYYDSADYVKAQMLFDELYSVMRNTEKSENIAYYLAYCDFNMNDYVMAGYLFRSYFKTYPTSSRASECLYMSAYCHYKLAPPWSLDQEDTYAAIDEFQYYIQMFPNDTAHIHECNKLVDQLHSRLEKKAYMNAKMYYQIADYKAAITSFELLLHDYPDTHYREDANYFILESKYYLAINSVDAKKEDRITDAINACNDFLKLYTISEYTGEVKQTLDKALKVQEKLAKDKKTNTTN